MTYTEEKTPLDIINEIARDESNVASTRLSAARELRIIEKELAAQKLAGIDLDIAVNKLPDEKLEAQYTTLQTNIAMIEQSK